MSLFSRLDRFRAAMIGGNSSPAALVDTLKATARRFGAWLDYRALWIYGTLAALIFAICRAAVSNFTIEPDEAWILLSTFKAWQLPVPGAQEILVPTVTSGGVHFLIHGAIGMFTRSIAVHRAVSLLFLAALVMLVFDTMRRRGAGRRDAAIAATLVLTTPGLVLQASLAMAEIVVTVLLLATAIYWERKGRLSLPGSALTGVLLGLSFATRANCLVCLPLFLVFACLDAQDWTRGLSRAAAMLLAALATYFVGVLGYTALFSIGDWDTFKAVIFGSTGVSVEKSLGQKLSYLLLAADFFPPFLIAGLLAGIVVSLPRGIERLRLPLLLVALGVVGALAWVAKAPIPHVRYAWPFAPFLYVAAGLLLHLTGLLDQARTRLAIHLFLIAALLQQAAASVIYVASGDSLIAVYQANRMAALASPIAGRSDADNQQEAARFIAGLPANAELMTNVGPLGLPLSYLSGRWIHTALRLDAKPQGPRYYVSTPGEFAVFHPGHRVMDWLRRNGAEVFRTGDYAIYAVTGQEPFPEPRP